MSLHNISDDLKGIEYRDDSDEEFVTVRNTPESTLTRYKQFRPKNRKDHVYSIASRLFRFVKMVWPSALIIVVVYVFASIAFNAIAPAARANYHYHTDHVAEKRVSQVTSQLRADYGTKFIPQSISNEQSESNQDQLTLDELLSNKLFGIDIKAKWISDHELLYSAEDSSVRLFDAKSNRSKSVVKAAVVVEYDVTYYDMSRDKTHILLAYEVEDNWRYSFEANYMLADTMNGNITPFEPLADGMRGNRFQLVMFGPRGTQLVFVHSSDLYYMPSARAKIHKLNQIPGDYAEVS